MTVFDRAFDLLIRAEGGYGADPRDRGNWDTGIIGKGNLKGTKYGISAMSFPQLDIKNLTLDQAKGIYKIHYWDKIGGDKLPPSLALVAFDTAVNSGVGRAHGWLDRTRDWNEYLNIRLSFMQSLSTWKIYGKGWSSRINTLRNQARNFK